MLRQRCLALLAALMLLPLPFAHASAEEEPLQFQLHQVNIGCADAYLLLIGDVAIMIDGGNDTGVRPDRLMTYLRAAGFDHLTAYIVTHYHDDHAGNLLLIMDEFGDENTVVYGPSESLPSRLQPLPTGTYAQMREGDQLTIGPLSILCIGPSVLTQEGGANVDSLNFIVTYGSRRYLFTGDFAHSAAYLEKYADAVRDVDVLKFPHHGLERKDKEPFYISEQALRFVNPTIIVTPGAYAKVSMYVRKLALPSLCYGNGDGNFIIYSDGESLDVVTGVEPGQYAGVNIP